MSIMKDRVEAARELLQVVLPDEDWDTDHLENTPDRFVKMLHELTHSGDWEPGENFTTFENQLEHNEMVVVRDIPFYTLCAHHIIPFFGKCHVAYIPEKMIAGLSKFPRLVQYWCKGLWVQENLTDAIATTIETELRPLGTAVVMEAEHLCMTMRGVQVPGTKTITSVMKGVFLDDTKHARHEFLSLIASRGVS